MREKPPENLSYSCSQIAHSEDESGSITAVELKIVLDGIPYLLNIATSKYVSGLREYNSQFPEDQQLEDRFYTLEGETLPLKEELCRTITEIPLENLQPFLIEMPKE